MSTADDKAQKISAAKAAALAGLERQAQGEAMLAQIEADNAAVIKALCEAAGQSGPIKLDFASGSRIVQFRHTKAGGYKMSDWEPATPV